MAEASQLELLLTRYSQGSRPNSTAMASNIPRAVSRKKLRLGQQLAVLETQAPDLPSVAELRLSFAKRPGSHTGARKFMCGFAALNCFLLQHMAEC